MGKEIHTVGELIEALKNFPQEAPIIGTWESKTETLYVYRAQNGTVIIDADGCDYQELFETGEFRV